MIARTHLLTLGLSFFLFASVACAQSTPTSGEKSIGQACKNGASAMDFDALAQCSSLTGAGLMQKAPLFAGTVTAPPYATTDCDASKAGLIQWTGSVFQGCTGLAWSSFNPGNIAQTEQSQTGGFFTISSKSYVAIPACKISVTSSGGKVLILASVDAQASGSGATWGILSIFRDNANLSTKGSTLPSMAIFVANAEQNMQVPLHWIDAPPAGQHLYQIYAAVGGNASGSMDFNQEVACLMQAIELRL